VRQQPLYVSDPDLWLSCRGSMLHPDTGSRPLRPKPLTSPPADAGRPRQRRLRSSRPGGGRTARAARKTESSTDRAVRSTPGRSLAIDA